MSKHKNSSKLHYFALINNNNSDIALYGNTHTNLQACGAVYYHFLSKAATTGNNKSLL